MGGVTKAQILCLYSVIVINSLLFFVAVFLFEKEPGMVAWRPIIALTLEKATIVGYAIPAECHQAKIIIAGRKGHKNIEVGLDCSDRDIVSYHVWSINSPSLAEQGYVFSTPILSQEEEIWL